MVGAFISYEEPELLLLHHHDFAWLKSPPAMSTEERELYEALTGCLTQIASVAGAHGGRRRRSG